MTKASRNLTLVFLSICLLIGRVSCGSIAAWWNTRGPSLMMQDNDTGNIRYSRCNGNHTPVFPDDETLVAPLRNHPPKTNTSLSAVGWVDGQTTWASIFYLDKTDEIVNTLLECDWNSGQWQNNGDFIISTGAPQVAPNTGLAAVLLPVNDGYRVFYNDPEGVLHHIGYASDAQRWSYYGVVSRDRAASQAVGSSFSPQNNNITVVRPRDGRNIGVSRSFNDHLWHISTFPQPLTGTGKPETNATNASDIQLDFVTPGFELPAWDGNAASIAVGTNGSNARSVFYIGTDKRVHQVGNTNTSTTWSVFERPSDTAWPQADVASGHIGIASDFTSNALRLYYMSDGEIVEINGDNNVWQDATVLPKFNESEPATRGPDTAPATAPAYDSDLSEGAKAGISVGVTLGVIAILGMLAAFYLLRRRQRRLDEAAAAESRQQAGSPSGHRERSGTHYHEDGIQFGTQDVDPAMRATPAGYPVIPASYTQRGHHNWGYAMA
ncbi:hypothetical protein F4779DRAFT_628653 [Xylariaceae sp. FL0662B]|nr:hypothetical protein F4779DRAFT_628653 [Xylariaceae sp. FL0662B]